MHLQFYICTFWLLKFIKAGHVIRRLNKTEAFILYNYCKNGKYSNLFNRMFKPFKLTVFKPKQNKLFLQLFSLKKFIFL